MTGGNEENEEVKREMRQEWKEKRRDMNGRCGLRRTEV